MAHILPEYEYPSFHPKDHPAHAPRHPKAKVEYRRRVVPHTEIRAPGFNFAAGDTAIWDAIKKGFNTPLMNVELDYAAAGDNSLMAATAPIIGLTAAASAALMNKDFAAIKAYQQKATADLQPIVKNVSDLGNNAFVDTYVDGQLISLSYSATGTYWVYPTPLNSSHRVAAGLGAQLNDTKYANHVQIGSYSLGSGFAGISNYVLTNLPMQIAATAISFAVTSLLKNLIQQGLDMLFSRVLALTADYLLEAGFEVGTILAAGTTAITASTFLVMGAVGILVFLVMDWLMTVLFKKYVLSVNIYNFDESSEWRTDDTYYSDNAIISAGGTYAVQGVPKFVKAGGTIFPPGFQPVTPVQNVCSYMTYVFENDSKFLEGLTMGLKFNQTTGGSHFMAKYNLRRLSDNQIGLQDGNGDVVAYGKDSGSYITAKDTSINVGSLSVTAKTNALSGASDGVYEYYINIGTVQ